MDYEKKTIEEKAKAYDEAAKIIKANLGALNDITEMGEKVVNIQSIKNCFYRAFPELKESEDEQSKKWILEYLYDGLRKSDEQFKGQFKAAIAWLEKQGEKKPADNIKPRFKVGDWILYSGDNYEGVRYITKIDENGYYIERNGLPHGIIPFNHEICMKLWTIQDAKDGDVLASNLERNYISPFIAIYKNRGLDYFTSYCFIGLDGKFYKGDTGHDMVGIHPATKEQCDLLFKKMKEAGYKWNPMTLKLNKEIIGDKKEISDEQKLSEEDKERIQRIYTFLWKNRKGDTNTIYQIENDAEWLKNLNTK